MAQRIWGQRNARTERQNEKHNSFCLPDNFHLNKINICTYTASHTHEDIIDNPETTEEYEQQEKTPNNKQWPDDFLRVCVKTEANEQWHMVILYESEYHNINPQTPGDGCWLWNKMFQTMRRFHDTDINVSTVMISDVIHRATGITHVILWVLTKSHIFLTLPLIT